MDEIDPHIHVDADLHAAVSVRDLTSATFGLVGELPRRATTGCGIQVPYAMTSNRPASVTCLACREYAHRRYLELAAYVERVSHSPGTSVEIRQQAARSTVEYREIAKQYASTQD